MITTGIIREINISSGNYKNNKYKVELNIFQIPGDTDKNSYTFEANCMVASGFSSVYNVGDKVFVGFLNNDKSFPIILGKIYQGISDDYRGYGALTDLKVKNSVELPNDILIGEYDYDDIDTNFKKLSLLSIQQINQIITLLASTPLTHKHLEAINETAKQLTEQINRLNSIISDTNDSLEEITEKIAELETALDEEIAEAITLLQDEIKKEVDSATEDFNATIADAKDELNVIIDAAKTDLQESIDEVEAQIAILDATIQELTDMLKALWDGINRKIDLIECVDNSITAEMTTVSKTINVTDDVTQETSSKTIISNNVKIATKISNNVDNDLFLDNSDDTPGLRVHKYQIKRSEGTADAAAVYQLMVDGKVAGDPINIPHDLVVESGTVEIVKEKDTPYFGAEIGDFYIKLVIKNQLTPICIPANSLVEYVTSGSKDGDDIIIDINEKHQVSAVLGATVKSNIETATKYNQPISITLYVTVNKAIEISGVLGWRWVDMCDWAFKSSACTIPSSESKDDFKFEIINGFVALVINNINNYIYYTDSAGNPIYVKPSDLIIDGTHYYISNDILTIEIGKAGNYYLIPNNINWKILADHIDNSSVVAKKCEYVDTKELPVFVNIPTDSCYFYKVTDFNDAIDDTVATNIQWYEIDDNSSRINNGDKFKLGPKLPCNRGHDLDVNTNKCKTCEATLATLD